MFEGLDDAYALTPLQEGMLYETLKHPESDIYVAYIVIDIRGGVDRDLLHRAWEKTVQQHETLRTRFVWDGLDEPLQLVNTSVLLDWSDCTAPGESGDDINTPDDAAVAHWLQHERRKVLALSEGPPVRFRLLYLNAEHSVLFWTVHHLLADDWSTPLVLQSVANHYGELLNPGVLPVAASGGPFRFARYVEWLSQIDQRDHLNWWWQSLCDVPDTSLQFEPGSQLQAERAGEPHHRHDKWLSLAESRLIERSVTSLGVTLSSLMHAAWALVVARYAGTTEAVFGTSVSGRTCPLPDVDRAVGLFLNTVPSRIDIAAEVTRDAFVKGIQQQLFEQIAHEHVSLAQLMKLAPGRDKRALFDTVLVVETHGSDLSIAVPDSTVRFDNIRYVTDSNFPLTVLVFPGNRLQLQLVGPASGFSQAEMAALGDEFVAVLADLCAPTDTPIATLLNQQTARMAHHYPYQPLKTQARFQRMDLWMESQVLLHVEKPAIIHDGQAFSYAQLWRAAHGVARAINALPGTSDFVGICLGRGFDQIAAIVGVLISDHGYIPLDPAWPVSRIQGILSDAGVTGVVCDSQCCALVTNETVTTVMMEDLAYSDAQSIGTPASLEARSPVSPAYMIYTSGSTGKPKGVAISHANLVYSTAARLDYYAESPERFLLLSSFSFDSSIAGIFWSLCTGGTLVLPGESLVQDIHEVEQQIAEHGVTHTLCLPSLYALLLRFSDARNLSSLRRVIVAGEACPAQLPELHGNRLPDTALSNEYGPTEATVWASVADISQWTDNSGMGVPIGRGIPGAHLEVIGPEGQLSCPGISGELVVSSPGVADGYFGHDALNQWRFGIRTPSSPAESSLRQYKTGDTAVLGLDGQLYYLGRTDSQLKIRGHRIEAGEIESRVARHAAVHEACCVAQTQRGDDEGLGNDAQLICYYSLNTSESGDRTVCTVLDHRQYGDVLSEVETLATICIKEELPPCFAVSRFVAVNTLPRLSSGKVDVQGFPVPHEERRSQAAIDTVVTEQTTLLNQLCDQLASLLNLPSVNADDNFFSLGGDSLRAIRYVAACREQGILMNVPMVAATGSLAELAEAVEKQKGSTGSSLEPPAVDSFGQTPLSPVQRWFFSLGLPGNMRWSMAYRVKFHRAFSATAVSDALQRTVAEYPVLSTCFAGDCLGEACIPDQVPSESVCRQVSTNLPEQAWQQALAALQAEFDLESGSLLRCLITVDADGQCRCIGVVVHHLVTDALSNWQFARRLLQHLYADSALTPSMQNVMSFREWSMMLNQISPGRFAEPGMLEQDSMEQVSPVRQTAHTGVDHSAIDVPRLCFKERDCVEHRLRLDAAQLVVINQYCQRQSIGLHEYLLFIVLSQAGLDSPIRVDVETHGRDILDAVDSDELNDGLGGTLSRSADASVGWFSSFFPLIHDAGSTLENVLAFRDLFRHNKQAHRLLFSQDPIGYFTTPPPGVAVYPNAQTPAILYNYLAVNANEPGVGAQEVFSFEPLLTDDLRDGDSPRTHAIDIVVLDDVEGAIILWRVDAKVDEQVQAALWAERCHDFLLRLSAAGLGERPPAVPDGLAEGSIADTIADALADTGLDAQELDQFLDSLE